MMVVVLSATCINSSSAEHPADLTEHCFHNDCLQGGKDSFTSSWVEFLNEYGETGDELPREKPPAN